MPKRSALASSTGSNAIVVDGKPDDGRLQRIQHLQFSDRPTAETLMRQLVQEVYASDVQTVELRPSPVSLNSIHGFLNHADGRRYFFKTHTETDTLIGEYYRAQLIADAGFPVIQPIFQSGEVGKQLLVYESIADPSVFEVAWEIETEPAQSHSRWKPLLQAQAREDAALFQRQLQSLQWQDAAAAAKAPIHQLFHHRLTGGRYQRFYADHTELNLVMDSETVTMPYAELRELHWQINGQEYAETLTDIVSRCCRILQPAQPGPAIIGHGDAHNGNVFLQSAPMPQLSYFDPAFAGWHHPLLDLAKPLFHNAFAMWMYFPREMSEHLQLRSQRKNRRWHIRYQNALPAVRKMFLESKIKRVLVPILCELARRNWLRDDWRAYLKAALACCPLLTLNLADPTRFPPDIALLGLAMTVEMGAESHSQRSTIDRLLDEVENDISQ